MEKQKTASGGKKNVKRKKKKKKKSEKKNSENRVMLRFPEHGTLQQAIKWHYKLLQVFIKLVL